MAPKVRMTPGASFLGSGGRGSARACAMSMPLTLAATDSLCRFTGTSYSVSRSRATLNVGSGAEGIDLMARIARSAMRATYSLTLLSALLASPASSELVQVDIVGTVYFEGCPYSGTCWMYPLMWGVSGGEPMTLRAVYDDGIPISGDLSQADHYFVCYDHAIPLRSPLGMEVSFGPYAVSVGSSGAAASYYWFNVFDVIEPYPNFPDLSEAIGINIEVPPGSVTLQGPPGFHDLELYGIYYDLRNFYGEDFLVGPAIPAGFPEFNWEDILLTVDVYDPIYDQDGIAFLTIDNVTLTTVPEPSARLVILAGAALLGLLGRRQKGKRRR
jgi:hypothetical protein